MLHKSRNIIVLIRNYYLQLPLLEFLDFVFSVYYYLALSIFEVVSLWKVWVPLRFTWFTIWFTWWLIWLVEIGWLDPFLVWIYFDLYILLLLRFSDLFWWLSATMLKSWLSLELLDPSSFSLPDGDRELSSKPILFVFPFLFSLSRLM